MAFAVEAASALARGAHLDPALTDADLSDLDYAYVRYEELIQLRKRQVHLARREIGTLLRRDCGRKQASG